MIDEATLATMLGAFLWLVYHCREWKKERSQFSEWMESRAGLLGQVAGDLQEVLEDILDGIQGGGGSDGKPHPSSGIGEILTALLMSNMGIPMKHGSTQEQERQVHEEEPNPSTSETENESH